MLDQTIEASIRQTTLTSSVKCVGRTHLTEDVKCVCLIYRFYIIDVKAAVLRRLTVSDDLNVSSIKTANTSF